MSNGYFDHSNFHYFKKLYLAGALILLALSIGVAGYYFIENYPLLDAIFMTVITVATVGYREVHDLSDAGKIFTSILIIFNIGTFAFAISVFTKYIIEGEFQTYFKHYKVNKEIQKLHNHVIVCGYGRNGSRPASSCVQAMNCSSWSNQKMTSSATSVTKATPCSWKAMPPTTKC